MSGGLPPVVAVLDANITGFAKGIAKAESLLVGFGETAAATSTAAAAKTNKAFDSIAKDAQRAGTSTVNASKKTSNAFETVTRSANKVGKGLTLGVSAPLAIAGTLAVKVAGDFESSMNQFAFATKTSSQDMGKFNDLALKMGQDTVFSANEAAGAMLNLAKGGIKPAEIGAGALKSTMALAAAGTLELDNAATLVTSSMNTFGISGAKSMEVADALAGAANSSNAEVSDLAIALSQAGQGAASAQQDIQHTAAALAAFSDNGIKGSDAGTSLKTMLTRLNPKSAEAAKMMKDMNLQFFDAKGNYKDLTQIAGQLQTKLGGLSAQKRAEALNTIFGSDAQRAANILTKEGADGLQKYVDAASQVGAAQGMADARMKGWKGTWEKFMGSLETAGVKLGNALIPTVTSITNSLEGLADAFGQLSPEAQSTIARVLLISAALGPIIWISAKVASGLLSVGRAFVAVGSAMSAMGAGSGLAGIGSAATAALPAVAALAAAIASMAAIWAGLDLSKGKPMEEAFGWADVAKGTLASLNTPLAMTATLIGKIAGYGNEVDGSKLFMKVPNTLNTVQISLDDTNTLLHGTAAEIGKVGDKFIEMGKTGDITSMAKSWNALGPQMQKAMLTVPEFNRKLAELGMQGSVTTGELQMLGNVSGAQAAQMSHAVVAVQRLKEGYSQLGIHTQLVLSKANGLDLALQRGAEIKNKDGKAAAKAAADIQRYGRAAGLTFKEIKSAGALAGLKIKPDITDLRAKVAEAKAKLKSLQTGNKPVPIKAINRASAEVAKAKAALRAWESTHPKEKKLTAKAEIQKASNDVGTFIGATIGQMQAAKPTVTLNADPNPALANIDLAEAAGQAFAGTHYVAYLDYEVHKPDTGATGMQSAPGGLATINEFGPEIVKFATGGTMKDSRGAITTFLPKGARVYPAQQSKEMLRSSRKDKAVPAGSRKLNKLMNKYGKINVENGDDEYSFGVDAKIKAQIALLSKTTNQKKFDKLKSKIEQMTSKFESAVSKQISKAQSAVDKAQSAFDEAQSAFSTGITDFANVIRSTADSVYSFASITNDVASDVDSAATSASGTLASNFGGQIAGVGTSAGGRGGSTGNSGAKGSIIAQQTSQTAIMAKFLQDMQALKAQGLNQKSMDQLLTTGPTPAALQAIQELMAGGVTQANANNEQLSKLGLELGKLAAVNGYQMNVAQDAAITAATAEALQKVSVSVEQNQLVEAVKQTGILTELMKNQKDAFGGKGVADAALAATIARQPKPPKKKRKATGGNVNAWEMFEANEFGSEIMSSRDVKIIPSQASKNYLRSAGGGMNLNVKTEPVEVHLIIDSTDARGQSRRYEKTVQAGNTYRFRNGTTNLG